MRLGLIISGVVHILVLTWTTLVFPAPEIFMVEPMRVLPVDIITASELTRIMAGDKDAEPPETEEAAVEPPKQDKPAKPLQRQASLPPSVAEPAPKPSPPPTPPERSAAPEPVPEPMAEPAPQPEKEPPAPEPVQRVKINTAALELPTFRPRPPKRQAEANRDFDASRIAALLNKSPEPERETPSDTNSDQPATQGFANGRENSMSVSELDLLRSQISRCWSPPIGVQGAEELAVRVRLTLNRNGTLAKPPETISQGSGGPFIAASDAARRAVIRCQPYNLPAEKFETWREIHITFDPRLMLGG